MKNIVIAGDIALDWIGWEIPADEQGVMNATGIQNWKFWPGLWMNCQEGGVLLINSFLKAAPWEKGKEPNLISYAIGSPEKIPPSDIIHSHTILEKFPIEKERKEKVIIKPEVAIIINTTVPPFSCSSCNIVTNNKKDFNKHLLTRKHLKCVNFQQIDEIIPKKISHQNCKICNKMFVSRSGLWRHNKKTCIEIQPQTNTSDDLSNIVLEFIKISKELQKQNTDLQKQILECMNNK